MSKFYYLKNLLIIFFGILFTIAFGIKSKSLFLIYFKTTINKKYAEHPKTTENIKDIYIPIDKLLNTALKKLYENKTIIPIKTDANIGFNILENILLRNPVYFFIRISFITIGIKNPKILPITATFIFIKLIPTKKMGTFI